MSLREGWVQNKAPLKVDREAGIIFKVKILGWESANKRRYSREAGAAATHLYEGAKAYSNHPDRPRESRANDDALGIWHNPVVEADGVYADLHYLKSHPMATRIVEDVERGLGVFGASHNADGEGETGRDGVFDVSRITEVRSIDIVTDPATVRNLWESRQIKLKLKQLLENKVLSALKAGRRKRLERILASGAPVLMQEADDSGGDYRDALHSAKKMCEDEGDYDSAAAIHKIMAPKKAEEEEEEDTEEEDDEVAEEDASDLEGEEEDAEEEDEDTEEDSSPEYSFPSDKKESRQLLAKIKDPKARKLVEAILKKNHRKRAGLTEAKARTLCKLAGLTPDKELLESLVGSKPTRALKLLEWAKAKVTPATPKGARSQGPGRPVTESRAPKDASEQATLLLR